MERARANALSEVIGFAGNGGFEGGFPAIWDSGFWRSVIV
jgi:hypothetical protein